MSEESKVDTHEVRQCWGRVMHHTWEMNAATYLLRTMAYHDDDDHQKDYVRLVLCNGLLAANSLMMTDLDELYGLLGLTLPDWDEIKNNQPFEMDLANAIKGAGKLARGEHGGAK